MSGCRVCHLYSHKILKSSLMCFVYTDPMQHEIYLFYRMKNHLCVRLQISQW